MAETFGTSTGFDLPEVTFSGSSVTLNGRESLIKCRSMKYAFDDSRHHCIYVRRIRRDPVFADMYTKLTSISDV